MQPSTRLTDAKKWAQDTESAIREGRHFKTAEAKKHTLAELIDRYTATCCPGRRANPSAREVRVVSPSSRRSWRGGRTSSGAYTLADVTPARIVEARDKLARTITRDGTPLSPSTVVRYMAPLSHAFGIAVREWGWLDDSPMRKVERPAEPNGRVRFLSDGEREALLNACRESGNPWLHTAVVVALSTGMRKAELMNLRWPDVDLLQGRITLRETKNGEIRVVPLAGPALALLKAHSKVRRLDTDMLFPGARKDTPMDLRAAWEAALKRAEIRTSAGTTYDTQPRPTSR